MSAPYPADLLARAQARAWLEQQRANRAPRLEDVWTPNPGPQAQAGESGAYELLFGGAAGGGKSSWLIHDALRHIELPHYKAILFRRSFPELEKTLIADSRLSYPKLGGRYNEQTKTWTFPSGARVMFGYLEGKGDELRYQGAEFQFVGFDELTHFTLTQYVYLFSRLRSAHGLRCRMRATTNPGGPGHDWVLERWAPWLCGDDTNYEGPRAAPGEILRYARGPQGDVFGVTSGRLSRQFIPARLIDNPHLASDEAYVETLDNLDPVTRAQLKEGRWDVRPAAGLLFKRAWFRFVDHIQAPPDVLFRVRYWDRAATDEARADRTAGVRLARLRDLSWVVEDVVVFRGTPAVVEATIRATAELDARLFDAEGRSTLPCLEQDPAAAGKFEAAYYVRTLAEFGARAVAPLGSKPERARVPSAQVESGHVALVRARWNEAFIQELEGFPDDDHDDQVDGFSGAMRVALERTRAPGKTRVKVVSIGGR